MSLSRKSTFEENILSIKSIIKRQSIIYGLKIHVEYLTYYLKIKFYS